MFIIIVFSPWRVEVGGGGNGGGSTGRLSCYPHLGRRWMGSSSDGQDFMHVHGVDRGSWYIPSDAVTVMTW